MLLFKRPFILRNCETEKFADLPVNIYRFFKKRHFIKAKFFPFIVHKPSLIRFHKRLGPIGLADLRQLTKQNACLNIINSLVPVNEYIHWHGGRFQFAP